MGHGDNLRINSDRLWSSIHDSAEWGAIPRTTGMSRLALTDDDRMVRDWFAKQATQIGCEVKVDQMGNMFAVLPGMSSDVAPIAMGSHLDTQPKGGRYDGILGVLSALEVLKTLKESGRKTFAPLVTVNWTNEEGARFLSGCTGSAVWSHWKSLPDGYRIPDREDKTTIETELNRIGYRGPLPADHTRNPFSAHFELHIEQGTNLETASRIIGVVGGIQGIRWYVVTVQGKQAHAGSTPMASRADAFVATARIILLVESLAVEEAGFGTVGKVEGKDCSSNTIAGTVTFTIDLRHRSETALDRIENRIRQSMEDMESDNELLKFNLERAWTSPAVKMDEVALSCVREAAMEEVSAAQTMDMDSTAGHDTALVSTKVRTAMLFVPSRDGISHAPEEYTSKEHCGCGAQVLLGAVLRYDAILRSKTSSKLA